MLDYYRFNRSVSRLKQEIDFTRRLSRIAHADIDFCIEQDGEEGVVCRRETDEPLSLPRTLNVPILIPFLKIEEEQIVLSFTSSGWVREAKAFDLYGKGKKETICFFDTLTPASLKGEMGVKK